MPLHTDKEFKDLNIRGKKVNVLAKDIHSKRKFEIKAKNTSA